MVKKYWCTDLKGDMEIEDTFLVSEKELRPFRNKEGQFLQIKLIDKTGSIRGKIWDGAEEIDKIVNKGDIINAKGKTQVYDGEMQLIIEPKGIHKAETTDFSDYLPSTKKNVDFLFQDLKKIVDSFKNKYLKEIVKKFFEDEEFVNSFKRSPGAKIHHHDYLGGLIEHTHGVVKISSLLSDIFEELDRELLLTGAILHDIGKTKDYSYDVYIDMTAEGGLIGHIIHGWEMLDKKINEIEGFPRDLKLKLQHLIISHHNQTEWGSPIEPRFPEACALSYADLCDSQTKEFIQHYEKEKDKETDDIWSAFNRSLKRFLYLGQTIRPSINEKENDIEKMKNTESD